MSRRKKNRNDRRDPGREPTNRDSHLTMLAAFRTRIAESFRTGIGLGLVDPVVLVLDPAYPTARALAELALTSAAVDAAVDASRHAGTRPAIIIARPRAYVADLLAPDYPPTATIVAAGTGPGCVVVAGGASVLQVVEVDKLTH